MTDDAMAANRAKSMAEVIEIKVSAEKATTDAINNQKEWVRIQLRTISNTMWVALATTVIINAIIAATITLLN